MLGLDGDILITGVMIQPFGLDTALGVIALINFLFRSLMLEIEQEVFQGTGYETGAINSLLNGITQLAIYSQGVISLDLGTEVHPFVEYGRGHDDTGGL